ncbi:TadE/TadG family type IV pilus assembly protein [Exercitatus varius]|uniref:TadE/TadG family type IV pilus assembly protein n=1 Tax=Exercitatus varius TaxID=67857 RepID=UPI00294B48B7|nr:TadE/TadG family type IV pilus assembly protein [Exercitatus varius]MDG2957302.1 pilus assembly protein [Exercitatus varius]
MMKIKNYTALLRRFYHNERGAYTVMMAIMSFALLGIVALTVDGSGMLLDKARFSQGIEQAGLALMAENNDFRNTNQRHEDVIRQTISKQEMEGFTDTFSAQKYKRNQELVRGLVRHYYYPSTYRENNQEINDKYDYQCDNLKGPNGEQLKSIACEISGEFERPSWLYLGKNNGLSFAKTTTINANKIYVQKNLDEIIPIDLMLVTDLSGSMNDDVNGRRYGTAKIDILRDVVASIAKELLEQNNTEEGKIISKYNRIGFTSFAFGAQQQSNSAKCYLPYEIKPSITVRNNYYYNYYTTIRYSELLSYIGKSQQRYSYATLAQFFDSLVDYDKTIESIDSFNGKDSDYLMNFNKNSWCLGNATRINSTYIWAKKNESANLISRFYRVPATGATLSSSGLLIGANLLMNTNPDEEAQPSKLGANTQRIILVLSDGADQINDTNSSLNITSNLINQGMCEKIKSKLDSLQDKTYLEQPTRIGFVAFGYGPSGTQKAAWEKCVGKYYYVANNKEELLESFRKIIGLVEEVGHSIYQPPSYYSN